MLYRPDFVTDNVDMLHDERWKRGESMRDVSRVCGVTLSQYRAYEHGEKYPQRENYNKLAKFFGWEEWE